MRRLWSGSKNDDVVQKRFVAICCINLVLSLELLSPSSSSKLSSLYLTMPSSSSVLLNLRSAVLFMGCWWCCQRWGCHHCRWCCLRPRCCCRWCCRRRCRRRRHYHRRCRQFCRRSSFFRYPIDLFNQRKRRIIPVSFYSGSISSKSYLIEKWTDSPQLHFLSVNNLYDENCLITAKKRNVFLHHFTKRKSFGFSVCLICTVHSNIWHNGKLT